MAWTGSPYPYIGLVVTSHNPTQVNTAVFDTVVGR
jgi:hypothetical protein